MGRRAAKLAKLQTACPALDALLAIPLTKVCFEVGETNSLNEILGRFAEVALFVQHSVRGRPDKALDEGGTTGD